MKSSSSSSLALVAAAIALANADEINTFHYGSKYIGASARGIGRITSSDDNQYCTASAKKVDVDVEHYCKNVGKAFDLGNQATCCTDPSRSSTEQEPICRSIGTSAAVCPKSDWDLCSKGNSTFELSLGLSISDLKEVSCCASCQCFADPHCQAFDGSEGDWAICDARSMNPDGSCPTVGGDSYKEDVCLGLTDGAGNQCEWVGQNQPFYKTNGPCQPNSKSPNPHMNFYTTKNEEFGLELELGSRGNIVSANFAFGEDNGKFETSLQSADCFAAWDAKNASLAWTRGIPDYIEWSWGKTNVSNYQIQWNLFDTRSSISMQINCATQWSAGKPSPNAVARRLDIDQLNDFDYSRAIQGSGYCTNNVIDYNRSIVVNNPDTVKLDACAFGSHVQACAAIIDTQCDSSSYEAHVKEWCTAVYLPAGGRAHANADTCIELLSQKSVASETLYTIFAQAIQFASQNLWTKTLASIQDGTVHIEDLVTEYNHGLQEGGASCVADWNDYTDLAVADECVETFTLQYLNDSSVWVDYMKIPATRPPCNDTFSGSFEEHRELFVNEWRVVECQVPARCNLQCAPIVGFNGTMEYASDMCSESAAPTFSPTPSVTIPVPTTAAPTAPIVVPQLCNSTQSEIPSVANFCDLVMLDSFENCCGYQGSSTASGRSTCREQRTNDAWCSKSSLGECSSLAPSDISMRLDLEISKHNPDVKCCKTCQCHGDPECTAFDGTHKAWVLCDARGMKEKYCPIREKSCGTQKDSSGNQCAWHKDIAKKVQGNQALVGVYGSPCRPSASSAVPTMNMYKTDAYSLDLSLGERGVITEVNLVNSEGQYQLGAEACWEAMEAGSPQDAWKVVSGNPLSNATFVKMSSEEIQWTVFDATSILTEVSCLRRTIQGLQGAPRLDVNRIVDSIVERPGEGFCVSNEIDIGRASPVNEGLDMYCQSLVKELYSQVLVDPSANAIDDERYVKTWCDLASINENEKEACFKAVFKKGEIQQSVWSQWLCKANSQGVASGEKDKVMKECTNYIKRYGIEKYVKAHGPGYLQEFGSEQRCGRDQTVYAKQATNACQYGISVEYLSGGEWLEELFIPADFPPCEPLEITADLHPNLFLNEVRFRQCDLPDQCQVKNQCEQVPGFATRIQFTGCK